MLLPLVFCLFCSFSVGTSQDVSAPCKCVKRNLCQSVGNVLTDADLLLSRVRIGNPICLDDEECCVPRNSGTQDHKGVGLFDANIEYAEEYVEDEGVTADTSLGERGQVLPDDSSSITQASAEDSSTEEGGQNYAPPSQETVNSSGGVAFAPDNPEENGGGDFFEPQNPANPITETPAPPEEPPSFQEPAELNEQPNPEDQSLFVCGVRPGGDTFIVPKIYTQDLDDSWTRQGDFPWTLLLKFVDNQEGGEGTDHQLLCGGALVLPNLAITAAHCIERKRAEDLVVVAGEWAVGVEDETFGAQERRVERIVMHPKYDQRPLMYDIAILVLDSPFHSSDVVNTICLPDGRPLDKTRCYATGWGSTREDDDPTDPSELRKAMMPLVSHKECEEKMRKSPLGKFFRLHKSFICAGGDGKADTCRGDGGGPLACESTESPYSFYLIGITSWGVGCSHKDIPGAYTDVSELKDWIFSVIFGDDFTLKENPDIDWSYRVKPGLGLA